MLPWIYSCTILYAGIVGMLSHKISMITIFGHNFNDMYHKFHQNIWYFSRKNFKYIFNVEIKLIILKQNYLKNDLKSHRSERIEVIIQNVQNLIDSIFRAVVSVADCCSFLHSESKLWDVQVSNLVPFRSVESCEWPKYITTY